MFCLNPINNTNNNCHQHYYSYNVALGHQLVEISITENAAFTTICLVFLNMTVKLIFLFKLNTTGKTFYSVDSALMFY